MRSRRWPHMLKTATSVAQSVDEFAARHDAAMREATHPDVDVGTRTLLAGLLSELQQIRVVLLAMRDSDGRAAHALNQRLIPSARHDNLHRFCCRSSSTSLPRF